MKKRFKNSRGRISILAAACLMVALCGTAMAAAQSYAHTFKPPHAGSLWSSYEQIVETNTRADAYVTHDTATVPTSHVLMLKKGTVTSPLYDDLVTNTITNFATAGKRFFTYKTGYGGQGSRYYMNSYPTKSEFPAYTLSGTWNT